MSFLARIELDASQLLSAGLIDGYSWHRRIWECFPGDPAARRDFLTRIDVGDGWSRAWLLSNRYPSRPAWCPAGCFEVKDVASSFLSHQRYAFDLRANPTRALVQRGPDGQPLRRLDGKRRAGKRVPIIRPDELRAWLDRKARDAGFRVDDSQPLDFGPSVEAHFRKDGHAGYHAGVVFRGVLEVIDQARFRQAHEQGIGTAKGFGFGLLLLAPLNPKTETVTRTEETP